MSNRRSNIFQLEPVGFSTGSELILRGSRDLFSLLPGAFKGIKQIGFIGWGSQAPAQAQNLRDSLKLVGSDIKVAVGLQHGSKSVGAATDAGFNGTEGTLGEMYNIIFTSDLVILLISDGAQTEHWQKVMAAMKPGATLGLSHGFLLGYLRSIGQKFRPDINVVMMAPKGMGRSVRMLYEQGREKKGAGINSSVAVEQDLNGLATDYALAWAVGTGSPATFFTTMEQEVISDLTGERGMLLGGLWGLSEALYQKFLSSMTPEGAFLHSAKGLTGTISEMISELGLRGTAKEFEADGFGAHFNDGYNCAYPVMKRILGEIYDNVSSWREITEVVVATEALKHTPMPSIETSEMWTVGKNLYSTTISKSNALAFAAGAYIAGVMAEMQMFRERGHSISEIVNESLIEAIDSLSPFMDARGVSYMVDNCSTTARLGARKWGPRFTKELLAAFNGAGTSGTVLYDQFLSDQLHEDIATCFKLRPPVKIAVT